MQRSRWCTCLGLTLQGSLVPPWRIPHTAGCPARTAMAPSCEGLEGASSCWSRRVRTPARAPKDPEKQLLGKSFPRACGVHRKVLKSSGADGYQRVKCPPRESGCGSAAAHRRICPGCARCPHPTAALTPGQGHPDSPGLGALRARQAREGVWAVYLLC